MVIRSSVIALVLLALAATTGTTLADGGAMRGIIKGTDGKPVVGAEVRAQRLDGKGAVTVAKTDAKGEYQFQGLELTAYKVTAVINKVPKSVASAKTSSKGWVRVDFDLSATAGKGGQKRRVWVPNDATGSHIGGGHWVEVTDTPNSSTNAGSNPVERIDGSILANPNGLNPAGGVSGPGH